jgi:hypothetical protein
MKRTVNFSCIDLLFKKLKIQQQITPASLGTRRSQGHSACARSRCCARNDTIAPAAGSAAKLPQGTWPFPGKLNSCASTPAFTSARLVSTPEPQQSCCLDAAEQGPYGTAQMGACLNESSLVVQSLSK